MKGRVSLLLVVLLAAGCAAPGQEGGRLDDAQEEGEGTAAPPASAPVPHRGSPASNGSSPPPSPRTYETNASPPAPRDGSAPGAAPAAATSSPPPPPNGAMSDLWIQIEQALPTGAAVSLPASPEGDLYGITAYLQDERTFQVVLQRSQALAADAWAKVEDETVPLPAVWAYEGHVEGKPEQTVRLTLADDWARGSIRVGDALHLVRINLEGNLPKASASAAAVASAPRVETTPSGQRRAMYEPADHEEVACSAWAPPYLKPMTNAGRATEAPIFIDAIADGDRAYADLLGKDAFPMMVAMMHEADAIYDHQVGVRLRIVGLHLHEDAARIPAPSDLMSGENVPLGPLEDYWNVRRDVARDFVHLFTGHASGYAQANCIGGVGHPEVAYAFTPVRWEAQSGTFHTRALAHELGHLFAAHHHYGNHVESVGATLMVQGYTPGDRPVFSTLTKSVIRGWAEEGMHS